MSQTEMILEHLNNYGSITSMDAFVMFGCTRLSARIHDLRYKKGISIESESRTEKNRYGVKCTFSVYRLAKKE